MFTIRTGWGNIYYLSGDEIEMVRHTLKREGGYTILAYTPFALTGAGRG